MRLKFVFLILLFSFYSCNSLTEDNEVQPNKIHFEIINDSNQYYLVHDLIKKRVFQVKKCNLSSPVIKNKETIVTIRDCDSLYICNSSNMEIYSFGLKEKNNFYDDTLIRFNGYLIYGLNSAFFVIDSSFNMIASEVAMTNEIEEIISKISFEEIINGYRGLSRLSEHSLQINLSVTHDSNLVCEYEFHDHIGLSEYFYDTINLKGQHRRFF